MLTVAGESVTDLAAEFGTPTYVVDEDDFRARARAFRDAFPDADVYYAGKAFLCVATARWVAEAGPAARRLHRRRACGRTARPVPA